MEYRALDPACNPYLAFAVILAAGLDGIRRGLDPPPEATDNIYAMSDDERRAVGITSLPDSLLEAVQEMSGDEVVADQESGTFLADPHPGAFEHHDRFFDIAGQFDVPRSPQGRPVVFQAGDSDEGRDFAAASADAIFSRHSTLEAGQAFYADVKGRLRKFGRTRGELLIVPAATFVLGDTDADAAEIARDVRRARSRRRPR